MCVTLGLVFVVWMIHGLQSRYGSSLGLAKRLQDHSATTTQYCNKRADARPHCSKVLDTVLQAACLDKKIKNPAHKRAIAPIAQSLCLYKKEKARGDKRYKDPEK